MRAKVADLELKLDTTILPLYAKGLKLMTAGMEKLNGFAERFPTLTAGLAIGFTAVASTLIVVGPLLVTVGAGMLAWAAAEPAVTAAIVGVVGTIAAMSAVVGGVALAIGVAALLIYRYWNPIKTYFTNWFATIKATFTNEMAWIVAKINGFQPNGM